METGLPHAPGSISRSRGLVRASTGVIVGLIVVSGIAIWLARQGAIADTEDDNHRLGIVLAEQTARTFQSVDFVLQEMSERIVGSGVTTLLRCMTGSVARMFMRRSRSVLSTCLRPRLSTLSTPPDTS